MRQLHWEIGKTRLSIKLGAFVNEGAAGKIYQIEGQTGKLAKLYINQQELKEYDRKVTAMIGRPPSLPPIGEGGKKYIQVAWPEGRLVDDKGRFCGFVMSEVDLGSATELSNIIQMAQRRRKGLPEFYGARVLLAANLSALMAELHAVGHCMIDMKPANLRFYPSAWYMAILDTDGFCINCTNGGTKFPSNQYTDNYIAPEAIGKLPHQLGVEQDLFALAIIIFELMNNGVHPYQGRDRQKNPTTLQDRIYANLYAYGPKANNRVDPAVQSIHEFFELETRALFDRAFQVGTPRPTAQEWRDHLRNLITSNTLRKCAKNPQDHAHFSRECGLCKREERIAKAVKQQRASSPGGVVRQHNPRATYQPQMSVATISPVATSSPTSQILLPPTPRSPKSGSKAFAPTLKSVTFLSVLALLGTWFILSFRSPTEPAKVSNQAPPNLCTQQEYDAALADGSQGLRNFLARCQSSTGNNLVKLAYDHLEKNIYRESLACIETSCDTEQCLQIYSREFSQGSSLYSLRAKANEATNSIRCNPGMAQPELNSTPPIEDGDNAMALSNEHFERREYSSALSEAKTALSIWLSSSPLDETLQRKIAYAHARIGQLIPEPSLPEACEHLVASWTMYGELGRSNEVGVVAQWLRDRKCWTPASSKIESENFSPLPQKPRKKKDRYKLPRRSDP